MEEERMNMKQNRRLALQKDEEEVEKNASSFKQEEFESAVVGGGDGEDALLALEIAASLLKKDRMDARQLGMETLCLLTDPTKSGIHTAMLASKVVLFGSVDGGNSGDMYGDEEFMPAEELGIREAILSLVQFGKLGEYIDFDAAEEEENEEDHDAAGEEFNALLHNLALAVLANSLEVLEQHGDEMARIGSKKTGAFAGVQVTHLNDIKIKTSIQPINPSAVAGGTLSNPEVSTVANTFLEETKEISKKELLATLLNVLGKAESKPHDACLSAQCLRSLFQASKKAKRKARDLNAKQIVNTALDVGRRTHVKLETETRNIMNELEKTDDVNEGGQDDRNNENQEEYSDDEEEEYSDESED